MKLRHVALYHVFGALVQIAMKLATVIWPGSRPDLRIRLADGRTLALLPGDWNPRAPRRGGVRDELLWTLQILNGTAQPCEDCIHHMFRDDPCGDWPNCEGMRQDRLHPSVDLFNGRPLPPASRVRRERA